MAAGNAVLDRAGDGDGREAGGAEVYDRPGWRAGCGNHGGKDCGSCCECGAAGFAARYRSRYRGAEQPGIGCAGCAEEYENLRRLRLRGWRRW